MFMQSLLFFATNLFYIYYLVEFEALKSYVDHFDWLVLSFDFKNFKAFKVEMIKLGLAYHHKFVGSLFKMFQPIEATFLHRLV